MRRRKKIRHRVTGALHYWYAAPKRVAHFRGRAVHSPFAYSLVSKVFRRHRLQPQESALYNDLRAAGIGKRPARQLQNLYHFCGYASYNLVFESNMHLPRPTDSLIFFMPDMPAQTIADIAGNTGATYVVMLPILNKKRADACQKLTNDHFGMSIDNRSYIVYFGEKHLAKQHLKL